MNFFNKFNKLTKRKIDYKKIFIVLGIILPNVPAINARPIVLFEVNSKSIIFYVSIIILSHLNKKINSKNKKRPDFSVLNSFLYYFAARNRTSNEKPY